uniref:TlpA family protein disulfide reductase n=1 Tax=Dictyoglomus thermophilum TaxID=14 RepID=A0A7C3MH67_DICTH
MIILFVLLIHTSYSIANIGENEKAIDFSLKDLKGKNYRLSDFKGKVILLNFWATWCPPCRYEMPLLDKLYKEHKNKGFEIVAVSLDSNPKNVNDYLKNNPVSFTILSDREGKAGYTYQIVAIPTSFLIDKNFIIRKIYLGIISEKDIKKELEKWLKK